MLFFSSKNKIAQFSKGNVHQAVRFDSSHWKHRCANMINCAVRRTVAKKKFTHFVKWIIIVVYVVAQLLGSQAIQGQKTQMNLLLVLPDGTFKLTSVTKFSFKHVMKHAIRIPRKCHKFFRRFATHVVSLKVPSGS